MGGNPLKKVIFDSFAGLEFHFWKGNVIWKMYGKVSQGQRVQDWGSRGHGLLVALI